MPGIKGLMCTRDDEDENYKIGRTAEVGPTLLSIVVGLFDRLEHDHDKIPNYFETENRKKIIASLKDKHFSDRRIPPPLEDFGDYEKDDTISNMAFFGIGQNYLKKATGKEGIIAYEVDTTILSKFETRPGYEMYGANAFFGEDKKLLEIYVSSMGKTIKPEDEEWMHAKWVWRSSLLTHVTIGTHLVEVIYLLFIVCIVGGVKSLVSRYIEGHSFF